MFCYRCRMLSCIFGIFIKSVIYKVEFLFFFNCIDVLLTLITMGKEFPSCGKGNSEGGGMNCNVIQCHR